MALIGLSFALGLGPSLAFALPQNFTVEGRLYTSAGAPLNESDVGVQLELLVENASASSATCLIYQESFQHVNVASTDATQQGVFALRLGTGTPVYSGAAPTLDALFLDGTFTGVTEGTTTSCTITAASTDTRLVRVRVNTPTFTAWETLQPDTRLSPVPTAFVAQTAHALDGIGTASLLLADPTSATSLTQTNLSEVFSNANFATLMGLIYGTASFGGRAVANVGAPVNANDVANKTYVDSTLGGAALDVSAVGSSASTNGDVLLWNSATNTWKAQSVSGLSLPASGTAGGDLTGSYPSPQIAANAVTANKINNSGIAINRLLITDSTTGAGLTYATCTGNQVMAWTPSGWQCTTIAALSPVSSVAGKTGAVTLNAADIAGLGSAALENYGTGAGDLVQLNGSAALPALDGSQLTGVNAVKLQSRAIAATAPANGQVLSYNAADAQWQPTNAASGTVTSVQSGLGLVGGPITTSGSLNVNVGVNAGQIPQVNGVNQLALLAGSAAAPTYSFAASSATGLFNPSVNTLSLATAGTAALTVSPSGLIGIGTLSPQAGLDINTFGGSSALLAPRDSTANRPTGVNGMLRYNSTANAFEFFQSGSWVAYNTSTATGTVTQITAGSGLTGGTITSSGTLNVNAGINANQIVQLNSNAQTAFQFGSSAAPTYSFSGNTGTGFFSPALNQLALTTAGTTALTVGTNGYVGIGTTSASVPLEVNGSLKLNPGALDTFTMTSPGNLSLVMSNVTGTASIADNIGFNGSFYQTLLPNSTGAQIQLSNGNIFMNVAPYPGTTISTAMLIGSNGSVGIGTNNPLAVLDVNAMGTTSALIVPRDTTANRPTGVNGMLRYNTALAAFEFFQNNAWVNYNTGSANGTVRTIVASSGLLGGTITSTGTVTVDLGTNAGQVVQLNGNAQVAPSAGSAVAPSYSFAGNTASGLYSSALNQISLSTAGTAALTVRPNGYVGFGTMSPAAGLDLSFTGTGSALVVPRDVTTNRPAGTNGMLRYNTTSNLFEFFQNNAWVTYGTSTTGSTVSALYMGNGMSGGTITSTGTLTVNTGTAPNQIVQLNGSAQSALSAGSVNSPTYSFASSSTSGIFSPAANVTAISTNGTTSVTIDPNGYVGIGTTLPATGLHLNDSANGVRGITVDTFNGNAVAPSIYLRRAEGYAASPTAVQNNDVLGQIVAAGYYGAGGFLTSTSFPAGMYMLATQTWSGGGAGSAVKFNVVPNGNLYGSEAMRLDQNGFVGIGTSSPRAVLDVYGNGPASAIIAPRDTTSNRPTAAVGGMLRYNSTTSAFEFYQNGTWVNYNTGASNGTVTAIYSGTGLLGGTINSVGTLSINLGTGAGQVVGLNASAQAVLSNGNPAAPTYAFSNSTATGLYSPGVNQLALSTAGTTAMTVDNQGRVGLGTALPTANLQVANDIVAGTKISIGTASFADLNLNNNGQIYQTSSNPYTLMQSSSAASAKVFLNSNGGTGGNTPAYQTVGVLGFGGFASGWVQQLGGISGVTESAWTSSSQPLALTFQTTTVNQSTAVERMRLTGSGALAIGTSIPAAVLDVYGTGAMSALVVPRDSTANRPAVVNGMVRYNTSTSAFEFFQNNMWVTYNTGATNGTVTSLTMGTGMSGGPITSVGTLNVNVGTASGQIVQLSSGGKLLLSNGASISPAFSFANSTSTGFYSLGSNQLSLATAGTSVLNLTADGRVGIGTTQPGAALDLNALGTTSALIVPRDTTANRPTTPVNGMVRYNASTNLFEFYQNAAWVNYNATLTSITAGSGLLGGTITTNGTLSVNAGTGAGQIPMETANGQLLVANGGTSAPGYSFANSSGSGLFYDGTYVGLATKGSAALQIDPSGNIGIGTNSPSALVEFYGTGNQSAIIIPRDAGTRRPSPGLNGMLRFATDTQTLELYGSGWKTMVSGWPIYAPTSGYGRAAPQYSFSSASSPGLWYSSSSSTVGISNGTSSLVLDAGKIGIGTLTPTTFFDVEGTTAGQIIQMNAGSGSAQGGLAITSSGTAPTTILLNSGNGDSNGGNILLQPGAGTASAGLVQISTGLVLSAVVGTSSSNQALIPSLTGGACNGTALCMMHYGNSYLSVKFSNSSNVLYCIQSAPTGQFLYLSIVNTSGSNISSPLANNASTTTTCPTGLKPISWNAQVNVTTIKASNSANYTLINDGSAWQLFSEH